MTEPPTAKAQKLTHSNDESGLGDDKHAHEASRSADVSPDVSGICSMLSSLMPVWNTIYIVEI